MIFYHLIKTLVTLKDVWMNMKGMNKMDSKLLRIVIDMSEAEIEEINLIKIGHQFIVIGIYLDVYVI